MDGRIAHILSCASSLTLPLRVCYPNVGKYYMQIASRAWHEDVCVCCRGELQFAHTAICPCYKFVHIVNSSILKFAHTTIRPCCNSSILQNSFTLQIRSHYNSPMWKGELQFAPTRVLSERWQNIICKASQA